MRRWWLLVCLAVPAQAFGQVPIPPLSGVVRGDFPWGRWEVRVPDKRQWLARVRFCDSCNTLVASDLAVWHVVDLDADGRPDLLRTAGSPTDGGEGTEGRAYRNTSRGMVVQTWSEARIAGLVRQVPGPGLYLVLQGAPFGMCEASDTWLAFLRPSASTDAVPFREESRVHFTDFETWPQTWLPAPIRVRVTQDQYNLRGAPLVDDTSRTEDGCESPIRGNVVATFRIGTTALALAQQRVGERIWYFLVTDPGASFTTTFGFQPGVRLAGWMSSRWLETIPTAPPSQPAAPPRGGTSTP
ncbi:MAG: hypothetical protein AAB409_03590 [Gemmatimonadota bacterium]